jgi:hypothetical protein
MHHALKKLGQWGRPESMQTLALLMTGIFNSRDVRLSRIAEQVPLDIQEDSVAHLSWLHHTSVRNQAQKF